MKRRRPPITLRRSVALPSALAGERNSVAPPEYVSRRHRQEFDHALATMAKDPQVQAACAAIARDFATAEMDGLRND